MMLLSAIAMWTHGSLVGADAEVTGFAIDTRKVVAGDLFVAIAGEHVDGHDYLDNAAARGAAAALVTRSVDSALPQILVKDAMLALGDLASAARAQRDVRVVGITGSNGKTTVKTLTASILARHGRTHVSLGNYNNELGLPLTLLSMPENTQFAVLEMGAGKPGDIDYLAAIARPDVGLVTLIAPAHLERMGSVEGVAETKGAIYRALPADGVAIINADDAFASFFAGLAGSRKVLRFGLDHKADVGADILDQRIDGSHFVLSTPQGDADVSLPLPGRHNIANALAAAAIALALDIPLETIVAGLELASGVAGRLRRVTTRAGWTLIDDSYNANPGSMMAAIDTLLLAQGERWLVLGDMAELGVDASELHAGTGRRARESGIDRLLAVGPFSLATVEAFGARGEHFADKASLIVALKSQLHDGVTCLIKGSRSAGMEQVVAALGDRADANAESPRSEGMSKGRASDAA
jgi:UDP-N-acetylmuramoyl-tripeptide--D-alanyl-D-alanine ligase